MTSARPTLLVLTIALLAVPSCSAGDAETSSDPDTLSRRQRDSIISTLPIPGAGAVGRALDAADDAAERAGRLDSPDPDE